MDFNRFTEKLQEAVRAAQSIAIQHGNQQLDTEHLLLALLDQEGGLAPSILNKADIRVDARKKWTGCPKCPAPPVALTRSTSPIASPNS
jgi:ATP-dependent Clp protease ATP-binding subunit ClpB